MFLLVGSRAAPWLGRKNDWDFFATPEEVTQWFQNHKDDVVSFRFRENPSRYLCRMKDDDRLSFDVDAGSARMFYAIANHAFDDMVQSTQWKLAGTVPWDQGVIKFSTHKGITFIVAPPMLLMLIKKSHYNVTRNWEKTIEDYHNIKRAVKREPTEDELYAYQVRCKEVEQWYGVKGKPNLNMSNGEFFAQSEGMVGRQFLHDDLHLATCYYGRPLYEDLKKDKDKAMMDKGLFFAQSLQDQLRTVREEAYAIALERYVIPSGAYKESIFDVSAKAFASHAYFQAFKRICTTLTKGWFRTFACEHYLELKHPEVDYVKLFCVALESGKLKPKGQNNAEPL